MSPRRFTLALALSASAALAEDAALPATLLATRGKLLASEDFAGPLAPVEGKPVGFASGFTGWRYSAEANKGRSGSWKLGEGMFTGMESPQANHPATASFGIQYKNAIIQCEVRLEDVPDEGRKYRSFFIKATDAKDYVCALFGSVSGLNALAYDTEHSDPVSHQRAKLPQVSTPLANQFGEWHTAVLEILGDELVATVDGHSVTTSSPLIGADKHSVMLGVGTQASFRHFRVWEALPNPKWAENKAALLVKTKPAAR